MCILSAAECLAITYMHIYNVRMSLVLFLAYSLATVWHGSGALFGDCPGNISPMLKPKRPVTSEPCKTLQTLNLRNALRFPRTLEPKTPKPSTLNPKP